MRKEYTFSNHRTVCPSCGSKRAFAALEGEKEFGYCHKCGTMIRPDGVQKQFTHNRPKKKARITTERRYINSYDMKELISIEHSNFGKYFASIFGEHFLKHCKDKFMLRADRWGATVFPYIDYRGRICTLKSIPYKSDGHRDKEGFKLNKDRPPIPVFFGLRYKHVQGQDYSRSYSAKKGYNTSLLFNEYALRGNEKTIIIVESEKTAVIASFVFTEYVFLASGGMSGLTERKLTHLKYRKVLVSFDNEPKAQEKAFKTIQKLRSLSIEADIINFFENANYPRNWDLADLLEHEYTMKGDA